jgi:7SK snRNA methylphosphate capping enzyme
VSLSFYIVASEALNRLAQSWSARRVIGVDIDDALVRMAWRRRRTLWSHQAPLSEPSASYIGTSRAKRKRALAPVPPAQTAADHFPASCQHMFGPLPIPPTDILELGVSENAFPHNITFRRADWVNERIPEDDTNYDVIIA